MNRLSLRMVVWQGFDWWIMELLYQDLVFVDRL